jgi:hypothetical protein
MAVPIGLLVLFCLLQIAPFWHASVCMNPREPAQSAAGSHFDSYEYQNGVHWESSSNVHQGIDQFAKREVQQSGRFQSLGSKFVLVVQDM